jgi:hypothetical protein
VAGFRSARDYRKRERSDKEMTREEAIAIIKNLKNYLRNEDKVKDKKLHEDVYTALDMAIKVMKEEK